MKGYLQWTLNSNWPITFHPLILETWNTAVRCAWLWWIQWTIIHQNPITGCQNVVLFVHVKIGEIFLKLQFWQILNCIISRTSDWNLTNYGSLDSPYQCASNRSIFISLGLMDGKLFARVSKQDLVNNFPSINPRDMRILRLDVPVYDESNEP